MKFKALVVGFSYFKPIVQINGTFLYGKYKEILLVAVAQDGASHILLVGSSGLGIIKKGELN